MLTCSTRLLLANNTFSPEPTVSKVRHLGRMFKTLDDVFFNPCTLAEALEKVGHKELVLYFHGWATPPMEAYDRAVDLQKQLDQTTRECVVMLMLWPCTETNGINLSYHQDKIPARESAASFGDFLSQLTSAMGEGVHIVTHSMGARVLAYAVERMPANPKYPWSVFDSIHMIAPDVPQNLFNTPRGQKIVRWCDRLTVYHARDDLALNISAVVNLTPRLGLTGPATGGFVHSVDCSEINQTLDPVMGHTYYLSHAGLPSITVLGVVYRMDYTRTLETDVLRLKYTIQVGDK